MDILRIQVAFDPCIQTYPWSKMTENSKSKSDERFQRVVKDPRFRRPGRKTSKIRVDDRFKGIFSDPKFTRPYSVDKYGRKVETKKAAKKEMEKFYRLESDDEESRDKDRDDISDSEGIETDASIEDDYSEVSESESESESEQLRTNVLEDAFAQHPLVNTNVILGDATRRLAIVNVDWDQLKAVDLFVLVSAFKPPMGQVKSVKIYPSEFGKERIQKESIEGPPKEIFASTNISDCLSDNCDDSDSDDSDVDPLKDLKDAKTLVEESGNFDQAALRRYQLERLRYFYAVVECDSVETAAAIYHHCDGREFETSTNTLDLRYIPDDVEFNADEATDSASSIPKKYTAKPAMVTDALQRSNVKLTWDQDDPDRRRLTRVNHGKIDYEEADLRAYLASDSESDSEEKAAAANSKDDRIARYRALLLSKGDDENVFGRKSHDDNDRLDITFASALSGNVEANETSDSESSETGETERVAVFDADGNLVKSVETEDSNVDGNKKKPKPSKQSEKFVLQKEWKKKDSGSSSAPKKMRKKQSDLLPVDPSTDTFRLDLQDDRFKAVYDSPAFAIDPTAPMYKKTKGMEAIIEERQKRRREGDERKDASRKKRN